MKLWMCHFYTYYHYYYDFHSMCYETKFWKVTCGEAFHIGMSKRGRMKCGWFQIFWFEKLDDVDYHIRFVFSHSYSHQIRMLKIKIRKFTLGIIMFSCETFQIDIEFCIFFSSHERILWRLRENTWIICNKLQKPLATNLFWTKFKWIILSLRLHT